MGVASKKYKKLFSRLRKEKNKIHDIELSKIHDDVFAVTDCLACANCCKNHSPIFIESDIIRIAKHLRMSVAEFFRKHLLTDEDGDIVLHTQPYIFLAVDNKCSIYEYRPKACREYPHTNRKKIYQIEDITIMNAEVCPAAEIILNKMINKMNIQ